MDPERPDDDRAAWRRAYRSTLAAEPAGCPSHDALAALAIGELAPEERARVADHVTTCVRCASDYRLVAELHQEASAARRAPSRWLWRSVAAAAVVVVAAGVAWRVGQPALDPDGMRGGEETQGVVPLPNAALTEPPGELVWRAESGARGYRVRIFDARAELVWESEPGPETSRSLPPDVRSRLLPSAAYFWVVDVEGAPGAPRLGPFWFQLKGGG